MRVISLLERDVGGTRSQEQVLMRNEKQYANNSSTHFRFARVKAASGLIVLRFASRNTGKISLFLQGTSNFASSLLSLPRLCRCDSNLVAHKCSFPSSCWRC